MIDLHSHTLWSDGELIPAEHIRRAYIAGYSIIAITDHADCSNIDILCKENVNFVKKINQLQSDIKVVSGIELTHVQPEEIKDLTEFARNNGIEIIVVHGETIVEPVKIGTNLAAIKAGVDILAHPGLITEEEVILASKNLVYLEITSKKGHSLANGHVAKLAFKHSAKLVINTDSHSSDDFISDNFAIKIIMVAGIDSFYFNLMQNNSLEIVKKRSKY